MSMPSYNSLQRAIERKRQIPGEENVNKRNPIEIVLEVLNYIDSSFDEKFRENLLLTRIMSVFCFLTAVRRNLKNQFFLYLLQIEV